MKIVCSKSQWALLQGALLERWSCTETSYTYPRFYCVVKVGSDETKVFDIDGIFMEIEE